MRSKLLASCQRLPRGLKRETRVFSTAFDPYHYLHHDTTKRNQAKSFQKLWEQNTGDFKSRMNGKEIEALDEKVAQTKTFSEFQEKMVGLFGPRRHFWIRKTKTWAYTNSRVIAYIEDGNHPSRLIFEDNKTFDSFKEQYLEDPKGYLPRFSYADLRYMCAIQCMDYAGCPPITPIFGCRNHYHYSIPDPRVASAHWQNAIYDRVEIHHLVLVTCVNAIKNNKAPSPVYFKELLDSMEHSALKDQEWRALAKQCSIMPMEYFVDQIDRAFNNFQTDPGVSSLPARYDDRDIDWEPNYLWQELYYPTGANIEMYDKEAEDPDRKH